MVLDGFTELNIVLYVNDLILTGDEHMIHSCKEDLAREFEIKDMGLLHYFLGLEIWKLLVSRVLIVWKIKRQGNIRTNI